MLCNIGRQLNATATSANHSHSFAFILDIISPSCCVTQLTFEIMQAFDLGPLPVAILNQ
jgi:hypothetical protein